MSYIAKKIKGVSNKRLREAFPYLKEWCGKKTLCTGLVIKYEVCA